MSERKTWTAQEDDILKQLHLQRGIKKWSTISAIMAHNYHIQGRSGKQCRERYQNHLRNDIKKEKWSEQQQQKLIELHSIHGNKWAFISKLIEGRTENSVKNMFNSKLRKSVRFLNRFIYLYYRRQLKEIKNSFVTTLSKFSQAAHKKCQKQRTHEDNVALHLKKEILKQGGFQVHQMAEEHKIQVKALVEQINNFNKDNQRYCRGNVLARLRKQKLKNIKDNEASKIEKVEEQILLNSQCNFSQKVESVKKISTKERNNLKQNNTVQEQNFLYFFQEDKDNQGNQLLPDMTTTSSLKRRSLSLFRPDNLQSNYPPILFNQVLENPMQEENYQADINPMPRCKQEDFLEWSLQVINWKPSAD